MHHRPRTLLFTVLAAALLGAAVWWLMSRPASFTPPPLPDPNGYDDIVRAGQLLPQSANDWRTAELETLRTLVADQAEAVALAREGLAKECRVPLAYEESDAEHWVQDLPASKSLVVALCAEARLAQAEGRQGDAAQACLDAFAMGTESTRGGLLLHAMVRTATDANAGQRLRELQPLLSADQARDTARKLEKILADRESLAAMIENEMVWVQRVGTLRSWISGVTATKSLQPHQALTQRASQKCLQGEQQTLRLLLDLAARAYELDRGAPPASAADLVPAYLDAVPLDPATGAPLQH